MIRPLAVIVVAILFAAGASGQFKDKKEATTEKSLPSIDKAPGKSGDVKPLPMIPSIPGEVEINLLNGSTVRMVIQNEKLEIATPFGQLSVPNQMIRSIDFGLHFPEGVETKIDQAVKKLGAEGFRDRDQAGKTLVDLGPYSFPAAVEASKSSELEVAKRAKEVVKQLQLKHQKRDLKTVIEDKVVTTSFTIVGRILNPTIKANAELFGQVDFPVARIRGLRTLIGGRDVDLTIDSARYANAGQWLETDFMVDGQNPIVVTASGLVDVWPQQGGNYIVGPNGLQGRNMGMAFNAAVMGPGKKLRGAINGQIYGGMLLGKIGEDGETFTIGERYEGTPEVQGKLYLQIGASPWNQQCSGTYDVKIARKN